MSNMENNISSTDTNKSVQNECDSPEVDSILDGALGSSDSKSLHDSDTISTQKNNEYDLETEQYINDANAAVLLKTLAPQIRKNEKKKREHKDKLIKYLARFLAFQFAFVFIIIMVAIVAIIYFHADKNPLSQGMVNILFAFFGTYLTSVVVELIYILKYIVEQVFDASISSLTRAFSGKDDKGQEN